MDKGKLVEVGGNTSFGAVVFGLTLNDVVAIITIIYLMIQIIIAWPELKDRVRNFTNKFKQPDDQ